MIMFKQFVKVPHSRTNIAYLMFVLLILNKIYKKIKGHKNKKNDRLFERSENATNSI